MRIPKERSKFECFTTWHSTSGNSYGETEKEGELSYCAPYLMLQCVLFSPRAKVALPQITSREIKL